MAALLERRLAGREYLAAVTTLLQRSRAAHPTAGLYEAADLQWWWRTPRSTDDLPQLFWFDPQGLPVAAVIATDWGNRTALDPLFMTGSSPAFVSDVIGRGLDHARSSGLGTVGLEVDPTNEALISVLAEHSFEVDGAGVVESWLAAAERPAISPLPDGYRLSTRLATMDRSHHMISARRNQPDPEPRLRETSLYRPDLDLVVHDDRGAVAAYGLFWHDPVTATGLVEPMRTEDEHQRRGLARRVLTTGLDLLAGAGARRIKICFEPHNQASEHLYLNVGFEPLRQTIVYSQRAREPLG